MNAKWLSIFVLCLLIFPVTSVLATDKYTEFQLSPTNGYWYLSENEDFSVKCGNDGYFVFWWDEGSSYWKYRYVGLDGELGDTVTLIIDGTVSKEMFHVSQNGNNILVLGYKDTSSPYRWDVLYSLGTLNNESRTISWDLNNTIVYPSGSENGYDPEIYSAYLYNGTHALLYLYDEQSLLEQSESEVWGFFWLDLYSGVYTRALKTEIQPTSDPVEVLYTVSDGAVHFFLGVYASDWNTYFYTISYGGSWSQLQTILITDNAGNTNFAISQDAQYFAYNDYGYLVHILKRGESTWAEYITPVYVKYSDETNTQLVLGDEDKLYLAAWNNTGSGNSPFVVLEISDGLIVNSTTILTRQYVPNNFFTRLDGVAFYCDYYGKPYGVLFDPFVIASGEAPGNSTYVVNVPPFVIESTTPFITTHYQPDGASWASAQGMLYFEVVGGGNATVWAPGGFPGSICFIYPYSTIPFAAWAYLLQNPPVYDFANSTVTFYNIPQGDVVFRIGFATQGNSITWVNDGGGGGGYGDDGSDGSQGNSIPDLGEAVGSALSAIPEPLRAPVAFTLVGLPIILILLLITGGGATAKGAYRRAKR